MNAVEVLRDAAPGDAALDVAVSHALLREVAAGDRAAVLRVFAPRPTVAFGRLDALVPGFPGAAEAARAHGFAPVVRAPGGRAAAYDGGSLVVEEILAGPEAMTGMQRRFAETADALAEALRAVGVDARVGAVPREYCPGAHTVNARGRVKLVGTAQRVVRNGWLAASVIVVRHGDAIRDVLTDVYAALGVDLDPGTVGAVEDEAAGVTVGLVRDAVLAAYGERHALVDGTLDAATLAAAAALRDRHDAAAQRLAAARRD